MFLTCVHFHRVKNTTPQMAKSMMTKKIEDLNFKVKRMAREETALTKRVEAASGECSQARGDFEAKRSTFEALRTEILGKMQLADQRRSLKDVKLNLILHLQNRARWYRAIKSKRYRPTNRDEGHGSAELTHVMSQVGHTFNFILFLAKAHNEIAL